MEEQTLTLAIGDSAPQFSLPATDDVVYELPAPGGADATVVVFTCNHCPYALAWEDRILDVGREYGEQGASFFAINPNDDTIKPADSFEEMKRRLRETPWPIPYLRDETQQTAAAYGALTTPDVFVFDRDLKLAYRGAPDADYDDPSQNAQWLREALDAVLSGATPDRPETEPVGCSVKWRR